MGVCRRYQPDDLAAEAWRRDDRVPKPDIVAGALATLVKIEGVNHQFKAGKKDVLSLLAAATGDWCLK